MYGRTSVLETGGGSWLHVRVCATSFGAMEGYGNNEEPPVDPRQGRDDSC